MFNAPLTSTREVAQRLGITVRSVARIVERGELTPAAKAPGPRGAFMFDPTAVDELVAEREAGAAEQLKAAS